MQIDDAEMDVLMMRQAYCPAVVVLVVVAAAVAEITAEVMMMMMVVVAAVVEAKAQIPYLVDYNPSDLPHSY